MANDYWMWKMVGGTVLAGSLMVYGILKWDQHDKAETRKLQQQTVSYVLPKDCDTVLNSTRHINWNHGGMSYNGATLTYRTSDGRIVSTTYMFKNDVGQDIEWKPREAESIDAKVNEENVR